MMQTDKILKILVAEDDQFNQQLIQYAMEHIGAEVDLVPDGISALNQVLINKYDLILMDLNMPVMDGFEATTNIRRLIDKPEQPIIIAFSSEEGELQRQKCLESGFDVFLPKSSISELSAILKLAFPEYFETAVASSNSLMSSSLLADIADNDEQLFKKLLSDFLVNGKADLLKLGQALVDKDQQQFAGLLHKIKGTYLFMGAESMVALLRSIEKMRLEHDLIEIEELVYELRTLFEQLVFEIQQIISDIK